MLRFMNWLARIQRFWWWLWTGHDSLEKVRMALEQDVRRFGGEVKWGTGERAFPPQDDAR